MKITILDYRLDRIHECELAVKQAVKEHGVQAVITHISEPPYLSRLNVWDRLPALEIDGLIWSRDSQNAFSKEEVRQLLHKYTGKYSTE